MESGVVRDSEQILGLAECEELDRMAKSYMNEMRIRSVEDAFSPFGQVKLEQFFFLLRTLRENLAITKSGTCAHRARNVDESVQKTSEKTGFFSFSDILVYGGIALKKPTKKYNGQQILSLHKMRVEPLPENDQLTNAFSIYTSKKSFTLLANSAKEKDEWVNHLKKCAQYCYTMNETRNDYVLRRETVSDVLPDAAPVWISDSSAIGCMICSKKFTIISRRHHCRHCGSVICSDCSKNKFLLTNISSKDSQRVCDSCFNKLSQLPNPTNQKSPMLQTYEDSSDSSDDNDAESSDEKSSDNATEERRSGRTESIFYANDDKA